jgi:hypothetical protein
MFGSVGSTWGSKPSPPRVSTQSLLAIPLALVVRAGAPGLSLSWVPPYTL